MANTGAVAVMPIATVANTRGTPHGSSSCSATRKPAGAERVLSEIRSHHLERDDVAIEVIAQYLGTVANGLAFSRVMDDPIPDLDQLLTLIETGVAPR